MAWEFGHDPVCTCANQSAFAFSWEWEIASSYPTGMAAH